MSTLRANAAALPGILGEIHTLHQKEEETQLKAQGIPATITQQGWVSQSTQWQGPSWLQLHSGPLRPSRFLCSPLDSCSLRGRGDGGTAFLNFPFFVP